ncbi:MAG: hypothetical protein NC548_55800 [Lachnospiraceae bacterium]|nr:hypothetical protein [Lachnospiraceae bacterium]
MRKTIYIMLAGEKTKPGIADVLSRAYAYMVRICISLFITDLAARFLIGFAFAERGYEAVGGEYIAIPVVFFGIYKITGLVGKFISAKVVKTWKKRK